MNRTDCPGNTGLNGGSRLCCAVVLLMMMAVLLGTYGGAHADTIFSDNFDAALSGWTLTSHPDWFNGNPKNGTRSVQMKASEAIERLVSTAGCSNISISFALAAYSLDNVNEVVRASWYNGTAWTTLKEIRGGGVENDQVLRQYNYALPASANDNQSLKIHFEIVSNSHANDYGWVDDVLVTGQTIPRTLTLTGTGHGAVKINGVPQSLPWSGQFPHGTSVTVEAVPAAGWEFSSWSGDGSGSANPRLFVLNSDKAIMANFSQLSYTLSVAKVGGGSAKVNGAVVSLPYSTQFLSGTAVTVEAVPAAGWEFGSWSGDASGSSNPVVVTMTGAKSVIATFNQLSYMFSLNKVGSGSVKVNGATVSLPYSAQFLSGTAVTLEVVPASGWEFGAWSGDASGSSSPVVVTMTGPKSVTATFNQLSYTLSLNKVGNGSVKVNGATVSLPYSAQFLSDTAVNLEGIPASGWQLSSWSGDASSNGNPVVVTMTGAKSVIATFNQLSYTLSVDKAGSGTVKVNGVMVGLPYSAQFLSGTAVSLEAIPASGWRLSSWSGDTSGNGNPIVVTMTGAKLIAAGFSRVQYTLSLSKVGSGTVKVNGTTRTLPWSGTYDSDDTVTLEAVPDEGWRFAGWSGDASWPTSSLIVTMTSSKSIVATFEQQSHTLSITRIGNGSVLVDGTSHTLPWSGQIVYGTQVQLQAVAAEGWQFGGWSGDLSWQGALLIVTMTSDKNLTATFNDMSYTLSLAKVGSGSVTVNGIPHELPWSGDVLIGSQVTLQAVPASGWQFSSWSGDASWPGATLVVTMTSDKVITVSFTERTTFELSLSKTGSGTVSVNGSPVSLPWSGVFARDSEITIEAGGDSGWQFDGWSGDLSSGESTAVVTMDRDWTISAAFSEIHYGLSVAGVGNGTIEVNDAAQTLPWSGSFLSGTQVVLRGVADRGWRFASWSGDVTGTDNPVTIEMNGDKSVSANFLQPDEFVLSLTKVGAGIVKVNGAEQSLPWSGVFARGSSVTLEAVADGAEVFTEWSGDVSGSENPITVTMDYDMALTAHFLCVQAPYADVSCDYWAAGSIIVARDAGIAGGYPDGLYRPQWTVDRASMAVFIARALAGGEDQIPEPDGTEPTFPDIPADHWAYAAISYVADKGIADGYEDGKYHPDWDVTRGQMAVFIARAIADPIGEDGLLTFQPPAKPTFSDVPATSWCYRHIEFLVSRSVTSGYADGRYRPAAMVTRDQMAVYIVRAFEMGG